MFQWCEPHTGERISEPEIQVDFPPIRHASKHATAMALGGSGNYNPLRRDFICSATVGWHRERGVGRMAT